MEKIEQEITSIGKIITTQEEKMADLIFKKVILPFIDKTNYKLAWSMGQVSLENKKETLFVSDEPFKTLAKRVKKLLDLAEQQINTDAMWHTLSIVSSGGMYSKKEGFKEY